jgi:hypothetical protein
MRDKPAVTAPHEPRTCVECGEPFTLTDGERQWIVRKGLHLPKRCAPCRARRQREREQERKGLPAGTLSGTTN